MGVDGYHPEPTWTSSSELLNKYGQNFVACFTQATNHEAQFAVGDCSPGTLPATNNLDFLEGDQSLVKMKAKGAHPHASDVAHILTNMPGHERECRLA